jgi:folate-binding protein YgfZ
MALGTAELLASGQAFADLSSWRKVAVSGIDAMDWLNDLVSADISDVGPGRARHSLLLARTGSIRAAFTVATWRERLVLIQDPVQPSIADFLAPYVLSSAVELGDRTAELTVFALPGRAEWPDGLGEVSSPSSLGGGGVDLFASGSDRDVLRRAVSKSAAPAGDGDAETWRITQGIPRVGVDVLDGDLPQEAGLAARVSRDKGCFVGQEAVAKLDNLGRPRRRVLAFAADGDVTVGDAVLSDGEDAGRVTSTAMLRDEVRGLARVSARAAGDRLTTARGSTLHLVRS